MLNIHADARVHARTPARTHIHMYSTVFVFCSDDEKWMDASRSCDTNSTNLVHIDNGDSRTLNAKVWVVSFDITVIHQPIVHSDLCSGFQPNNSCIHEWGLSKSQYPIPDWQAVGMFVMWLRSRGLCRSATNVGRWVVNIEYDSKHSDAQHICLVFVLSSYKMHIKRYILR